MYIYNFSETKTKVCFSLHYNSDNSSLFVNGKEISKLGSSNKNHNVPTQFCVGSISNKFDSPDAKEVVLIENIYDF